MSAVSEVLNLNFDSADWRMVLGNGRGGSTRSQEEAMVVQVIHAALLPTPTEMGSGVRDLFGADRPLLGILCILYIIFIFSLVLNFFFYQGCKWSILMTTTMNNTTPPLSCIP